MPVLAQENTIAASTLDFVTANDWVLIRAGARQMKFAQGEALIVQDSPGGIMYFLRSGYARIVTNGVNVARIGSGQICGEIAFLDNRLSSASVIAEELIEADAIEWTELNRIFRMFPHVGSRFYQSIAVLLSRRLRETSSRLADAQMR
jgi:CRP-like cAMP-binding protein